MRLAISEDNIFLSFSPALNRDFVAQWELKSLQKEEQTATTTSNKQTTTKERNKVWYKKYKLEWSAESNWYDLRFAETYWDLNTNLQGGNFPTDI